MIPYLTCTILIYYHQKEEKAHDEKMLVANAKLKQAGVLIGSFDFIKLTLVKGKCTRRKPRKRLPMQTKNMPDTLIS